MPTKRNSKVILSKNIKLDIDHNNVLSYNNTDMLTLMTNNSHQVYYAENYSFIRKDNTILVKCPYGTCISANYIAFQNPSYNNKWFFGFITNITYINDKTTSISFKIDSWTTWYGAWTAQPCFIVREHVNDDTIGANTVDEGLDVGEVTELGYQKFSNFDEYYVGLLSDYDPYNDERYHEVNDGDGVFTGVSLYNGNFWASQILLFGPFKLNPTEAELNTNTTRAEELIDFLYSCFSKDSIFQDSHIQDIHDMFIVPSLLIDPNDLEQEGFTSPRGTPVGYCKLNYNFSAKESNMYVAKPTVGYWADYTPKNNKCYVYPYNYMLVTNNTGTNATYKYEDFSETNCHFKVKGAISIGASMKIAPQNYKGIDDNETEAISLGKFPTCGWSVDSYINWLTQNSINLVQQDIGLLKDTVSYGVSLGAFGSSVAEGYDTAKSTALNQGGGVIDFNSRIQGPMDETNFVPNGVSLGNQMSGIGGPVGGGLNLASKYLGYYDQYKHAKMLPNIGSPVNTGDVNFASGDNTFVIHKMRSKLEYIKIIDDYFTRFGYKINRILSPNINGRTSFNYLQIGPAENVGYGTNVPQRYMDEINQICRNGVTIWHSHDNIGNYSVTNTITS